MFLRPFIRRFMFIFNNSCKFMAKNRYKTKEHGKSFIIQSLNNEIKHVLKRGFNNVLRDFGYISFSKIVVFSLIPKIIYRILKCFILGGFLFFAGINCINYKIQVGISYFKDLIEYYIFCFKTIFEHKNNIFLKKDKLYNASDLYDTILSKIIFLNFIREQNTKNYVVHNISDNSQVMLLTKRMIEIKSILQQIKQNGKFIFPNIVVIGSQSSGKSSVLEAIIGHNFLPKGVDMVTRRPIELTLIHTFDTEEYGEFPDLKQRVGFDQIQKIIADLNFCVSENDYISDEPIKLNIFSPNVPDLTLIDLPGYIQVESKDQPISLKNKIIELCDKYIQEPNIILAVSAADVDLANSAALHASRKVDPNGIRTIGVVTKMDLVTPERGYKILKNINYPLNLGYVGVISNFPVHSFFDKNINLFDLIVENEKKYFSSFEEFNNDNCFVGIMTLREKLVKILENIMVHNLENIYGTLKSELEETSYQLKVEYNDRYLTPEIYMAELVDILKHRFKRFVDNFGKPKIRIMLKDIMNQKVLDLLAEKYWIDESIFELSKKCNNDIYWKHKLDLSTSCLTKLGIGRLVTGLLTSTIISEMEKIAEEDQFKMHPYVTQCIIQSTRSILKERYHNTVEQVENCVKPYKHEIDIDENEWKLGRESSLRILKKEIEMCQDSIKELKNSIGSKKLEEIISWIISGKNGSENMEYSTSLIEKGQHAIFLRDRENVLNARLKFLRSEKCKNMINGHYCPEIFLEIVAKKIVDIAVLFVDVELFSEFIHQFPRDLDNQLVYNLTSEQLEKIARENYEVGKQIDLQQKKALLELVLEKIKSLMLSGKNITDNR